VWKSFAFSSPRIGISQIRPSNAAQTPVEIEFSVNTTKILLCLSGFLVVLQWRRLFFCLITCRRLRQLVQFTRMRGCKDVSRGFGTCHSLHKYAYAPQTFGQVICDGLGMDVDADAVVVPRKFMRKLLTFSKINATSEILHMHANTRQAA